MNSEIEKVLKRLEQRMEQEDQLRHRLSAEEFAARRKSLMLAIGAEAGRFLNILVKSASPRRILEIGTSVGYSTLWLAEAARTVGGRVVTVDNNPDKHAQARNHLTQAGLAGQVDLVTGDAVETIVNLTGTVDFVLLDSERSDYISTFDAIQPKLSPGGLIAADNMTFPPSEYAKAYQEHVRGTPGYESIMVPIGNGIELSRKGT